MTTGTGESGLLDEFEALRRATNDFRTATLQQMQRRDFLVSQLQRVGQSVPVVEAPPATGWRKWGQGWRLVIVCAVVLIGFGAGSVGIGAAIGPVTEPTTTTTLSGAQAFPVKNDLVGVQCLTLPNGDLGAEIQLTNNSPGTSDYDYTVAFIRTVDDYKVAERQDGLIAVLPGQSGHEFLDSFHSADSYPPSAVTCSATDFQRHHTKGTD